MLQSMIAEFAETEILKLDTVSLNIIGYDLLDLDSLDVMRIPMNTVNFVYLCKQSSFEFESNLAYSIQFVKCNIYSRDSRKCIYLH